MKKFLHFGLAFYLLIAIVTFLTLKFAIDLKSNKLNILSPAPDFLTYFRNKQVSTLDLWFPQKSSNNKNPLNITAKAALLYDLTNDKIIYSKSPNAKLAMASLTKVMTAIVALENQKPDDKYFVSQKDLVGEDTMGLSNGETLSLSELLYGLILASGNDAAETIADNFPSGRKAFIKAMNNKVKALGLSNTNFSNPTGLEGDGKQYTTAYDLLVITKYALSKFWLFDEVVSTFDYNIAQTQTHKAYYLENETNLLTSYPGVKGIKTGFTPEAGLCLVTYLNYKGHEVIGILLGSDNRRGEMKDLLDFGLKSQGITPPNHI